MTNRFLIIIAVLLLTTPLISAAQAPTSTTPGLTEYKLLEPLPGIGNAEGKTTADKYISGLFTLLISLAGALAVLMLIYAGVKYMSTDAIGGKSEARGIITNVFWGLAFTLGAWLIVALVLPTNCEDGRNDAFCFNLNLPRATTTPNTNLPGASGPGPGASTITHQQAVQMLGPEIEVEDGVNLKGVQAITINEIKRLKGECGCVIEITSGTEGVHESGTYSHANGYKVDMDSTDKGKVLTNFITSKYPYLRTRSNDNARVYGAPSGAEYALEGDHWDLVVKQ